jgi:hypothetical protein
MSSIRNQVKNLKHFTVSLNRFRGIRRFLQTVFFLPAVLLAMLHLGAASPLYAATSAWVSMGTCHLQYKYDSLGNRVMDYSYAGYKGGGVALPVVPVAVTVTPVSGDSTTNIQAAITTVSAMPLDSNGFRGAVLLEPGTYNVSSTLNINASGVVLRGSGSGSGGSVLNMTGTGFLLMSIEGSGSWSTTGSAVSMTDSYVPSAAISFNVSSTSGFTVGDTILVQRPSTAAWIAYMGMNTIPNSNGNGTYDTWIEPGSVINTDRTIAAINGNNVTLDVPLTDSFDSTYLTGSIIHYTFAGRISEVGLEHLSVVAPAVPVTVTQFSVFSMSSLIDSWAQDLAIQDSENSMNLGGTAKRVTVENVTITHTYTWTSEAGPGDFTMDGTQLLLENCSSKGNTGVWPFTTSSEVTGPDVLLNCSADSRGFDPHQRWATGLLADGCSFPGGNGPADQSSIAYSNRGNYGSGQGWDAGWAVAWNVAGANLLVQAPPGVDNWCIGCTGTEISSAMPGGSGNLPNGIFDSLGTNVTLGSLGGSLYTAQLQDRLSGGCTPTFTATFTLTPTATRTFTFTATQTPTSTCTYTFTPTKIYTPTNTDSPLPPTNTFTSTPTMTNSLTSTPTRIYTPTNTNTAMSPTNTPSNTDIYTSTPTLTSTPTPAYSSVSATTTGTYTSTPTSTNIPSAINTATNTGVFTSTPVFTSTNSLTTTRTPTPVPTNSPTATAINTATQTYTASLTNTPANTSTNTFTTTPSSTRTNTLTALPTNTSTPTPTASMTPSATASRTPTASFTPTGTLSFTVSPTASPTNTLTGQPTATFTHTPVNTATSTSLNSFTATPTVTPKTISTVTATPSSTSKPSIVQTPVLYPNPVMGPGGQTHLQVPLTFVSNVRVEIFTTAFRLVQEETFQQVSPGEVIILTLTDKFGNPLANGLYYVVIEAQGKKWVTKLLILR